MTLSHPLSRQFSDGLQQFLRVALRDDIALTTVDDGDAIRVGGAASTSTIRFDPIPLEPSDSSPLLRVEFKLADDPSGDFFRVLASTFGLLAPVDKAGGNGRPVPIVRVEFERDQTPPAHIHFHTSSQTLGWVYGRAGGRYRRSEDLHFPIGSQRFRPTIEEFLLFLDQERLFRAWRPDSDWRTQARQRIAEYERRQSIAMVRHHADDIARELTRLGWTTNPPN